jgi:hypothetical protein
MPDFAGAGGDGKIIAPGSINPADAANPNVAIGLRILGARLAAATPVGG